MSASIGLTNAQGGPVIGTQPKLGSTVVAKVTLAASASASGPITSVTASPPLAVSPSGVLAAVGGPEPAIPSGGFTLRPGASVSYTQDFILKAFGSVTLSVEATGKDASGRPQTASDSLTARLGQPLSVTVNWLSNGKPISATVKGATVADTVRLADADDGEVPITIEAQVVIKNTSKITQEHVSLNGKPPFSFATKAQAVRALPVSVTAGPVPAGPIGTLVPGQTAKVDFGVRVANNGSFYFSPQVLSSSKGSTKTNISEGKSLLTVLPTKLLWLSLHSLEKGLVTPGAPVLIAGTVTNRSLTQTLDVAPLGATVQGNAGGGQLVDQASAPQPDGTELPFAGDIGPGDTIDVMGEVGTSLIPGSRAEVTYKPTGTVTDPDGSERKLTAADIGMKAGSLPVHISLNVSDPVVPPSDVKTVIDNFTNAVWFTTAKWSYLGFVGLGEVIQHPVNSLEAAGGGLKTVVVAAGSGLYQAGSLIGAASLLATVGQSWTDEERSQFASQVLADFEASHVVKLTAAVTTAVRKAGDDALVPFEQAVQTGDYNQLATLAGTGFGAGLVSAGGLMVSDIIFQKLALGLGYTARGVATATARGGQALAKGALDSAFGEEISLATALKQSRVAQTLGKGLAGIFAGQDLLAEGAAALTQIYGLTLDQVSALQEFCQTNKIIVAVRSRSQKAAELIRDGLAVGKNEAIKLKNVNEIDTEFLGYNDAQINTVVWAEPVPIDYVTERLAATGADPLTRKVVLERFALREKEWAKYASTIDGAAEDGYIDWGFNGSGNGAPGANRTKYRAFRLEPGGDPISGSVMKDRQYFQVQVGNKPLVHGLNAPSEALQIAKAQYVPITQDVDMMALLFPNGSLVTPELRAQFYNYLSDVIGIEHGETPSWIEEGEIIFQAKAKQLADAIPGGEALAVFGPNGSVTAGFYDAALTTFNNANKTGRIYFQGGYNSTFYLWAAKARAVLSGG